MSSSKKVRELLWAAERKSPATLSRDPRAPAYYGAVPALIGRCWSVYVADERIAAGRTRRQAVLLAKANHGSRLARETVNDRISQSRAR